LIIPKEKLIWWKGKNGESLALLLIPKAVTITDSSEVEKSAEKRGSE
jgi:hypothetical protein